MIRILVIIGLVAIGVCYCVYIRNKEENIKELLTSSDTISLETIMGFSNEELVKRLKFYYKNQDKKVLLEYADGKYLEISTNDSEKALMKQIESKQDFMIDKRYNPDDEYVVKECINKIMYENWLDYAYKSNYKTLFWREMNRLYGSGEVSTSSYNEVYRRFYKYKQMS